MAAVVVRPFLFWPVGDLKSYKINMTTWARIAIPQLDPSPCCFLRASAAGSRRSSPSLVPVAVLSLTATKFRNSPPFCWPKRSRGCGRISASSHFFFCFTTSRRFATQLVLLQASSPAALQSDGLLGLHLRNTTWLRFSIESSPRFNVAPAALLV